MAYLRILALVALSATSCSGIYFHINENEVKCFIEEVPDETLVTGKYNTERQQPDGSYAPNSRLNKEGQAIGIHVKVTDPSGEVVMQKDYTGKGRFVFNTHEPGEHTICLNTNSTRWFAGANVRVHLDMLIGEASNDYNEIQKKEQLTQVETRLYQLLAQVKMIANEQAYQRTREATFREISESTNVRVLWWSILQFAVLILTAYLQLQHLKGFFEAKKLV